MSEEQPGDGKKTKVNPVFLAGPAVAIGAALFAVFISTSNRGSDPPATDASGNEIVTAQGATNTPDPTATPTTPADPGAEGPPDFADATLEFHANIPAGSDPILTTLRKEADAKLAEYKPKAIEGAADRKANGAPPLPWEVRIDWDYTAKAAGIVSLAGTLYEFTGGAHGMTYTDTRIARAATGEELTVAGMLQPTRSPSPALTIGICEALKTEKVARINSPTVMDEPIVCVGPGANVNMDDAKLALAPSSEPDKFGGLYVFFEPYAVGAYAEGGYQLTIPHDVFREDLRKEFQPMFGGKPTSAP